MVLSTLLMLTLMLPLSAQGVPLEDQGKKKLNPTELKRKAAPAKSNAARAKRKAGAAKVKTSLINTKGSQAAHYNKRPAAMEAANTIAAAQQLDAVWVRKVIGQALYLPAVVRAVLECCMQVAKVTAERGFREPLEQRPDIVSRDLPQAKIFQRLQTCDGPLYTTPVPRFGAGTVFFAFVKLASDIFKVGIEAVTNGFGLECCIQCQFNLPCCIQ
jgi:hypothetical protein